jgi:hypothetical protein
VYVLSYKILSISGGIFMDRPKIVVLGSFVVDLMSWTPHLLARRETVLGGPFKLGPGGKMLESGHCCS